MAGKFLIPAEIPQLRLMFIWKTAAGAVQRYPPERQRASTKPLKCGTETRPAISARVFLTLLSTSTTKSPKNLTVPTHSIRLKLTTPSLPLTEHPTRASSARTPSSAFQWLLPALRPTPSAFPCTATSAAHTPCSSPFPWPTSSTAESTQTTRSTFRNSW